MNNPHDYLVSSHDERHIDPNNETSWVMLNQGGFVKLGNERVLLKLESRISCELSIPQELKASCSPFQRKSDKGTLFLTNKRVRFCISACFEGALRSPDPVFNADINSQIVYLPSKPIQEPKFESFSAPILNFQDSTTSSSMIWGWAWKSICIPVSGGGIPPDLPRIEVKFTFSDGGMMDFNETYIRLRERLHQFQEMRRDMGPGADVPDEQLPAYEAETGIPQAASNTLEVPAPRPNRSDSSSSRRGPNEPPPDYEEAQAQHLSMRLEDHIRDGVNRGEHDT